MISAPLAPKRFQDPLFRERKKVQFLETFILIVVIAAFSFSVGKAFGDSKDVNVNIQGSSKNNIQASHAFNLQPYILPWNNPYNMYCIAIDDWGPLSGSSMQPTFFEGNSVLLKNYTSDVRLRTGDIIRFIRFNSDHPDCDSLDKALHGNALGGSWVNNSMAVIHRINAIYDDDIVAQGDNLDETEIVHRCQITDVAMGILFT